jgi:hypothetical protein
MDSVQPALAAAAVIGDPRCVPPRGYPGAPSTGKAATLPSLRRVGAPAFPLKTGKEYMLFIPLAAAGWGGPRLTVS